MAGLTLAYVPLILLLAGVTGNVQQVVPPVVPPPTVLAGAPPSPAEELAATIVALAESDNRLTVPVQIGGAGPYRFVIDTGAERTVISRELAGGLRLLPGRPVNVTAMSGTTRVNTVVIPALTVSNVPDIGAIQAPALNARDLGALGLLGIDTLRDHRIDIDFESNHMTVVPSAKRKRGEPRQPDEIVIRAKSLFGQLIVTEASYDDRSIRVIIDTGTAVSVGNSALRRLVGRSARDGQPVRFTSVTGGVVQADYSSVDNIRVGGVTFNHLPIAFVDVAPFKRFGVDKRPAMLLGMDALKLFRRVQIDFANREVRFLLPRDQGPRPPGSLAF
jgi:predicted aspartyl protease